MPEKRYYWLKLPADFFQSKPIKKLRKIAGGDTYTVIYLKMLLKSLADNGRLYFEGIEETFCEEIALDIDENPDDVRVTIQFLLSSGLMTESPNGDEAVLEQMSEMIGSETASAKRKRISREEQTWDIVQKCPTERDIVQKCPTERDIVQKCPTERDIVQKCPTERDIVQKCPTERDIVQKCPTEIDIDNRDREESEKSKSRDRDRLLAQSSNEPSPSSPPESAFITLPLNTGEEFPIYQTAVDEFKQLYPAVDVEQQLRTMRAWCLNNPKKRKTKRGINHFVNSWLANEQDRPHPQKSGEKNRFAEKISEVDGWSIN